MLRRPSSTSSASLWCAVAEQHRLLAQRHARLAPLEDALDDVVDLRQLVGDGDEHGALAARAVADRFFS